ncbi:hypothetical protein C2G38_2203482 [Gigaspora rosea]|uniref:Uncharacterized protein n=1 Tax=Gigaspora rosea TaxID=44941 RepID=A0A397UV80_9GLOM|nr:hypothetical protein C2G38_2203482 [Gigaspora rosea]
MSLNLLEAFENAARSAAKYEGFAFSKKDSNLTGYKGKSPFVVLHCTKAVATKFHSTTGGLNTEVKWVITKVVFEHNYSILELDKIASFS